MILSRNKWICGFPTVNTKEGTFMGEGNTELLNKEGYMDVLGFICKDLGVKLTTGKIWPSDLKNKKTEGLLTKNGEDNKFAHILSNINDSCMPNSEREERIIEVCKYNNLEVIFE